MLGAFCKDALADSYLKTCMQCRAEVKAEGVILEPWAWNVTSLWIKMQEVMQEVSKHGYVEVYDLRAFVSISLHSIAKSLFDTQYVQVVNLKVILECKTK